MLPKRNRTMPMDPKTVLKKYYGYDSFRPLQEEIITHILSGGDCLVLMPTGGGKSVCFQIPAIMMEGTALVISPLISLMKDQVDILRGNGIEAASLNSSLKASEAREIVEECRRGHIKLLYISPERLNSTSAWIKENIRVSMVVVDEAHCISMWGHDFRPEYTQLGNLHDLFPGVPVAAFTATADKVTREDIMTHLDIRGRKLFLASFDRPNLSLSVVSGLNEKARKDRIVSIARRHPEESGIIYCTTRKSTEEVALDLRIRGISCAHYHAGLSSEERKNIQEDFKMGRIQIVCATVAFGMGIDKADVRFVIHYNMPLSIESYYQEIGRGGRDGMPCETVLFYNLQDLVTLKRFVEESGQKEVAADKLRRMQDFAESTVCRRRILLNYFGETTSRNCGNCDVCRNPPHRFDGTELVQKLLSAVMRTGQRVSSTGAIDILLGEKTPNIVKWGFDQIKTFGVGSDIPREDWQAYLMQMVHLGYVEIDVLNYRHLIVTPLGREVLFGRQTAELTVPKRKESRSRKHKEQPSILSVEGNDKALMEAFKNLRKAIAKEEKVPAYIILSDKSLLSLVERKPSTVEEFGECFGIGEAKRDRYGERFVRLVNLYIERLSQDDSEDDGMLIDFKDNKIIDKEAYLKESESKLYKGVEGIWSPELDRELLTLCSQGKNYRQIAAIMGKKEKGVKSRTRLLRRWYKKMRVIFPHEPPQIESLLDYFP